MTTRWISTGLLALATMGATGPDAGAQNALGGGNALDSNLGVGTGGINQPAAASNYRDRNLLVTGDVIGGRGFRDTVGYRAAGDFRDVLGSNDLFRFRADSAISSPQLFQLGTTYDQLRYGQSIGMVEYRRAGSGDPASVIARDPIVISDPATLRRMDRQTLVNSLAFTEQQASEPRIIGSAYARDGSLLYFNASTVRGIVAEPANQAAGLIGLSTYDTARIISDAMTNKSNIEVGTPFTTRFDQFNIPGSTEPGAVETPQPAAPPVTGDTAGAQRVDRAVASQHQQILERVVQRYAAANTVGQPASTEALQNLNTSYNQLRQQLTGQTAPPATAAAQAQIEPTQPGWQLAGQPGVEPPGTPIPAASPDDPVAGAQPTLIPETPVRGLEHLTRPTAPADTSKTPTAVARDAATMARDERQRLLARPELAGALRHGLRVDQLSTTMQDRFNELLMSAEKSLSEGEYFLAERRFERALRLVPGHPMASVGMAHAQLGAGLYLSASLTLRTLLAGQPEMIDVTYAPHLLPSSERLKAATDSIRERLGADTAVRERASYGFLLAYIGHQSGDEELVRDGLATMSEADPSNTLLPLLEQIWLNAESAPNAPPATPAPGADPQK